MFRIREHRLRLALLAVPIAALLVGTVGTSKASAALAAQCEPGQFCTAAAQAIPFGSGEELVAIACNSLAESTVGLVEPSFMRCYLTTSATATPVFDSGWVTSPTAQVTVTGLPGPVLATPYELCIQAYYTVVPFDSSPPFTVGSQATAPAICSFGVV